MDSHIFIRKIWTLISCTKADTVENNIQLSQMKLKLTDQISELSKKKAIAEIKYRHYKETIRSKQELIKNITNYPELYIKKPKQIL